MLPADWFEQFKRLYPARDGSQNWYKVRKLVPSLIAKGAKWEDIIEAARRYRIWSGRKGNTGTEYILMASSFLGRDEPWREWAEFDLRSPAEIAADAERIELQERALVLGFREIEWSHGIPTVRRAIEQAEREAQARSGVVVPDKRLYAVK